MNRVSHRFGRSGVRSRRLLPFPARTVAAPFGCRSLALRQGSSIGLSIGARNGPVPLAKRTGPCFYARTAPRAGLAWRLRATKTYASDWGKQSRRTGLYAPRALAEKRREQRTPARWPQAKAPIKETRVRLQTVEELERAKGIEPSYAAWEAAVLPLNYAREPGPLIARQMCWGKARVLRKSVCGMDCGRW